MKETKTQVCQAEQIAALRLIIQNIIRRATQAGKDAPDGVYWVAFSETALELLRHAVEGNENDASVDQGNAERTR